MQNFHTTFETEQINYVVDFNFVDELDSYRVTLLTKQEYDSGNRNTKELTMENKALSVMKSVFGILQEFKEQFPNISFVFRGSDEKRNRIYAKLLKRYKIDYSIVLNEKINKEFYKI